MNLVPVLAMMRRSRFAFKVRPWQRRLAVAQLACPITRNREKLILRYFVFNTLGHISIAKS
jgi:hypothetical protein